MLIDNNLHDEIGAELFKSEFENKIYLKRIISKIRKADAKGEIGSINRIFYASLRKEIRDSLDIDKKVLNRLDKANIYTWIAYTLYDDVLDEGKFELVSPANYFVRLSLSEYISAGINIDFLNEYFSIVDLANSSELVLRKGRSMDADLYKPLQSNKSIAHCIGQLWIIKMAAPQNFGYALAGCNAYCSARQLSDDIYDWREDLSNGQYTFATVNILQSAGIKAPDKTSKNDMRLLNIAFWQSELEHLCAEVIQLTSLSLDSFNLLLEEQSAYAMQFISSLKTNAEKSISNHITNKKEFEEKLVN